MAVCGPQTVVDMLFTEMAVEREDKVKEEVINIINMALLTYPSNQFSLDSNSIIAADLLGNILLNVKTVQNAFKPLHISVSSKCLCMSTKKLR